MYNHHHHRHHRHHRQRSVPYTFLPVGRLGLFFIFVCCSGGKSRTAEARSILVPAEKVPFARANPNRIGAAKRDFSSGRFDTRTPPIVEITS